MPYSTQNDASIYYEVHGEGSPLLLIYGLGGSKLKWPTDFVARLCQQHQVIIFDNRGTGQSDKPDAPYTLGQFVSDAIGILDTLGHAQASIFGISMGGAIAQHIALSKPSRISALILMGAGFGHSGGSQSLSITQENLNILTKPSTGVEAEDTRNLWPIMYPPEFLAQHRDKLEQDLQAYLAVGYPATPGYARQHQLKMLQEHNTYAQLGEITCPTLVQTGAEDLVIPPGNAKVLTEEIPHAQLIEYKGGGHLVLMQNPTGVAQDIMDFLATLAA